MQKKKEKKQSCNSSNSSEHLQKKLLRVMEKKIAEHRKIYAVLDDGWGN